MISPGTMIICLFLLPTITLLAQTKTEKQQKSLVLKDHTADRNPFHIPIDNSRKELWNAFMLVKDANAGDALAQHELGLRYLMGKGFPADTEKAAYWILKAADQNLTSARFNLGILLNSGLHITWNPFEAFKHFKYAAEHGMIEAEYVYGLLMTDNLAVSRNYAEAYRWITMAADSGYVPAKEALTEFKKKGIKTDNLASKDTVADTRSNSSPSTTHQQTIASSVKPIILEFGADSISIPDDKDLIQEALLEGNDRVKSALNNVPVDNKNRKLDSTLLSPLLESAEAGNPEELTLLGYWYEHGRGLQRDVVTATMYYLRAIRLESNTAPVLLWKMVQEKDYFSKLKSRVSNNEPAAQFSWAGLLTFGFDHQLTEAQALEFLKKAAKHDFAPAIVELGIHSYSGLWVKQDRENAAQLFSQAKQYGSREAELRLSMMDIMTEHTSDNDSTTLNIFRKALNDGSILAQEMLGYLYQNGNGVPRNVSESVRYYRKAAERGSNVAYNALRNLYDEIRPKESKFQIRD